MPSKKTKRATEPTSSAVDALVIYVHGIGEQEAPARLKQQWDLALFGRELHERSQMAYWADILHPLSSNGDATAARSARRLRTASRVRDEPLDIDALVADMRQPHEREFAIALVEQLGAANARALRGGPGKRFLPLPQSWRKPLARAFLESFIKDTAAYFFKPGLRDEIRQRLRDQLQHAAGRNVTIVAHSQGSVVAYEVLSEARLSAFTLDALITIGSPLGIREVQDFLQPSDLWIPKPVARWRNFADPLDPVAIDKDLSSDFDDPEGEVRVEDEVIMNSHTRRLWGFNPHAAVGYLAHPNVRGAVSDAMRMDPFARFVIARDVAERLGGEPGERHAVLIEALEPGYPALDEGRAEREAHEKAELADLPAGAFGERAELSLEYRVDRLAADLWELVEDKDAAEIDPLRRFVAARLTAAELQEVCARHRTMRVYAVWQSSRKAKLTDWRSMSTIKADAALKSFAADGGGITWAVLDTGVQADHPHFASNRTIKAVYDCTKRGPPVLLYEARGNDDEADRKARKGSIDRDGHGTHVSGIIAGAAGDEARGPDGERGLRGVAPRARLVVYKVLKDNGQGEDAYIIKALDHIAQLNDNVTEGLAIHGVNLSLGGPFDHTVYGCGFSPICAELRRLWRNGVLVVVACGNEGQLQVQTADGEVEINTPMSVGDPANLEECIAVGSVNADRPHLYGVSAFSSRGPTADGRPKPDLVAPGERILSCNSRWRPGRSNWYYKESGTSMAAPHVSGLLAAFLSVRREFRGRPDEVKKILLDSCIDLGRDRYHQGRGLPNLMQMLLAV